MTKDTTFIVPLRIESEDRLRNVIVSTLHLLENTKSKVIIQEEDKESIFNRVVYPQLQEAVDVKTLKRLTHVFNENADQIFHRTRILNDMTMLATTKVVVNYDCDILLPPESYEFCESSILDGTYDVIYPYGDGDWQYQVFADDELVSRFVQDYDFNILQEKSKVYDAKYGFCQYFNRDKYIEGGLENEHFIAYGYEDNERFYRFSTLGYNVGRLDAFVYHLEHARTANSWFTNPYIENNKNLYERIKGMNKEELQEYYKEVDYVKLRS